MTIENLTTRAELNGNGTAGPFECGFTALVDADIRVLVSGVEKDLTTHYTVANAGTTTNATVTFTSGNYPASGTGNVVLVRNVLTKQLTNYQNNTALDAETLEASFDKLTMLVQQLSTNLDRNLHFSDSVVDITTTDTGIDRNVADRSSKYLSFDADGNITVTSAISGVITYVETSISVGDVVSYDGSAWVNSKILARLSQINDSNGNEAIKFGTTGSAVNEITITNSATTNGPTLSATGGDANVDINITPKGTGELNVDGKIKSTNGQSFTQSSFHGSLIMGF